MQTLMKYSRGARLMLAGAALALSSTSALAAGKQTLCVWDIVGAQGDVFNMMKDYKLAAAKWGATLDLKPYTDEKIAAEDFKAGQCDAVVMTGLRARSSMPSPAAWTHSAPCRPTPCKPRLWLRWRRRPLPSSWSAVTTKWLA
jgi:hypothetical protein